MNKKYIAVGLKTFGVFSVLFLVGAGCSNNSSQDLQISNDLIQKHTTTTSSTTQHNGQIRDDRDFLSHMIPHHEEAIASSQLLLAKTQNEDLKGLLKKIISAQTLEVTQMRLWHKEWFGEEYASSSQYMAMMRPAEGEDVKQIEKNFLEDMIKHHEGAIEKANSILKVTKRNEIKSLTNHMIESQAKEIEQMENWKSTWFAE
jgi:uncharacterized protein (DUF305 family)